MQDPLRSSDAHRTLIYTSNHIETRCQQDNRFSYPFIPTHHDFAAFDTDHLPTERINKRLAIRCKNGIVAKIIRNDRKRSEIMGASRVVCWFFHLLGVSSLLLVLFAYTSDKPTAAREKRTRNHFRDFSGYDAFLGAKADQPTRIAPKQRSATCETA